MTTATTSEEGSGTVLTDITPKEGNKTINFFPAFPLLMLDIKNIGIDHKGMVEDTLALAGDTENYEGGFTTFFSNTNIDQVRGVKELKEAIYGVALAYIQELKYEVDPDACNIHMWGSVIRNKGYHGRHNHPRCVFSGTYYAQTEKDSGPIVFYNPTQPMRMAEPTIRPQDLGEFTSPTFTLQPETDQLIMWPHWLDHEVQASNKQTIPRVAYSFNVDFLAPGVLPKK